MFSAGFTVQPEAEETRTRRSCYVTEPLQQHSTTEAPGCKHTSSSPCRKKLPNNHRSNKATLIQLFRQRKGIHNLSIIGLFTVDQSTSIFKQLKCLWALGTAAQHVSLALQALPPPRPGDSTAGLGNAASTNAGPGWFLLPRGNVSPRHSQSHPTPYSLP